MTWLRGVVEGWRSGTRDSQVLVLALLVGGVAVSFVVSSSRYSAFPLAGYFLWLLLGSLLLRFGPLLVLAVTITVAGATARLQQGEVTGGREASLVVLLACVLLVLYASSRQRSGLPGPLSEALLADLRDRLNAQGAVPELPAGWHSQSAMVAAYGVGYAGDFMVADLDTEEQRLDLVLVDVVGKGVKAAPSALLLAGALGGLVGSVRDRALFEAANDFLLRQQADETFATAVHLSVDLATGDYTIHSAGHPPALRYDGRTWHVDTSRGLALGILPHPDLHASHGGLGPGEALLFYTDGVVESRTNDIEDGIAWLQETARAAVDPAVGGFEGAAGRIVAQVERGDDDRAVLIVGRGPE